MEIIEHRLRTATDNPNGTAWYSAYNLDVHWLLTERARLEEQLEALLDWLDKPHRADLWDALAKYLPDHFKEAGNPLELMRSQAEDIITLRDASIAKRTVWLARWGKAGSFNELGTAVSNPAKRPT